VTAPSAGAIGAAFLDRDGVINDTIWREYEWDSPIRAGEVSLLPGVPEAVRSLNAAGIPAVIISNQPIVAKGKATHDDLRAITDRIHGLLAAGGARVDAVYYCLHHPHAVVPELRAICDCRKPASGLIEQAVREHHFDPIRSYMVGDRTTDVQAGRAAGCMTLLVEREKTPQPPDVTPDFRCSGLSEAVQWILARNRL
jgi:histidinol-phosphate phosphatase family protein